MTWVRIDDQFFFKPRARQAGKDGRALFWAGLCYCAANLTDGVIVKPSLPFVAAMAEVEQDIADLLVDIGLWDDHGDRYEVIDYLTFQQSREQVVAEREAAAERKRRQRERDRSSAGQDQSHDTSHRDSRNGHAVSSVPPVPVPTDKQSSRRPGNSQGTSPAVDNPDDDGFFAAVFDQFAQLKFERQTPGKVKDPAPWKRKTAENARTELAETAHRWRDEFDVTPSQLAAALIDDKAPAAHFRRKDSA